MITFANAKINIGLHVTQRREDGYHLIETIFYPVKLYDVIEFFEDDTVSVENFGVELGQNNHLCLRAYYLLNELVDLPTLKLDLLKNIPIGAGLGGGSSDATHVLKSLNDHYSLGLSVEVLEKLAEQLGADCPFFVQNQPVYADGIGTTFHQVDVDLSNYFIVIIYPDIHISTAEAYSNVVPRYPVTDLKRAVQLPIQEWKYHIINDFELGLFEKYPLLSDIKNELYEKGALYASMTGSGSAIYGIFGEEVVLDDFAKFGSVYYPQNI